MNKRIQALIQSQNDNRGLLWTEEDKEEFAELILQDIKNLFGDERISLHYLEQPCCEDSVRLLLLKILEHFGVEE